MATLHRATFHCEVLTPMFLAGANQNCAPELRAASMRGAMRWWYRALLGGRGVTKVSDLKEKEAEVFGSTERASRVRVRVRPREFPVNPPSSIAKLKKTNSGTSYLWHFVQAEPNDRSYIEPGSRFQVELTAFPGDENALREAVKALWLLVHLGGLGTRSRRMAGSFSARLIDQGEGMELVSFTPSGAYDEWFAKQLRALILSENLSSTRVPVAVLHPDHVRIYRSRAENNWQTLVEAVGREYKDFRGRKDIKTHQKVCLGLPLATGQEGKESVTVEGDGEQLGRRASPLWLQAVRLPSGKLVGIFTAFGSAFAPPPVLVGKGRQRLEATPEEVTSKFLDTVDANPLL